MRVLGVDAGTNNAGWAVITNGPPMILLESKQITLKGALGKRLYDLFCEIQNTIFRVHPDAIVLEDGFSGGYASATKATAMARAAVLMAAAACNISVKCYLPTEAKKTLAGRGNATKDAVQKAARMVFNRSFGPDEADAVAVAVTCLTDSRLRMLAGGE